MRAGGTQPLEAIVTMQAGFRTSGAIMLDWFCATNVEPRRGSA